MIPPFFGLRDLHLHRWFEVILGYVSQDGRGNESVTERAVSDHVFGSGLDPKYIFFTSPVSFATETKRTLAVAAGYWESWWDRNRIIVLLLLDTMLVVPKKFIIFFRFVCRACRGSLLEQNKVGCAFGRSGRVGRLFMHRFLRAVKAGKTFAVLLIYLFLSVTVRCLWGFWAADWFPVFFACCNCWIFLDLVWTQNHPGLQDFGRYVHETISLPETHMPIITRKVLILVADDRV